jgi:hypothetical protein
MQGNEVSKTSVTVNRAPVLTLWASVVAERLGYDRDASLSLGKALAGLNAQSKGRSLGIYKPAEKPEAARKVPRQEEFRVVLLGRPVPAKNTEDGLRALNEDRPVDPAGVERYLEAKFGDQLVAVRGAMETLARAFKPAALAEEAYRLYERFRPEIPEGVRGWGAKGVLDLDRILSLKHSP